MNPETELVMFDLDGTIIDSTWIYYEIVRVVMTTLELPPVTESEIRKANRNGTFLWEKLFPQACFAEHPGLKDRAWEIARKIAPEMFSQRVKLLPGAAATARRLAASGRRLAIVTSTPAANMAAKLAPLQEGAILELFAEIVTADDTEKKKPEPDPLLECCRRLEQDPTKAVYIGDTRIDIRAGKAAGCATVGVLTGFDDREMLAMEHPNLILNDLTFLKFNFDNSHP
jgi:HAD superfamily hydrolase (TIGR01549 family)